jgi:dipeptidyl aminopeptidase/acylaminoacyl peptidase
MTPSRGSRFALCFALILGGASGIGRLAGSAAQAPDQVVPNENLVADGIPPIPRSLAMRAEPYMEFRIAALVDWHPVRREMLITTRFGETPQLHRVAFPGGARQQLTFYREPVRQALYRPQPARSPRAQGSTPSTPGFVFARDAGGSEFYQLFWRAEGGSEARMFTDGRSRNSLGPFSNGGRWLAYQSTRRNGQDTDIYLVDPADPSTDRRLLEVSGGGWSALDWSPDDRSLLVSEYLSANESRLYVVDAASGAKTLVTPAGREPVFYAGGAFAKDGRGIYLATDRDSEFHRLAYLELGRRSLKILTPSLPWDVAGMALSDDGRYLAYEVNEAGAETLHLLDLRAGSERPLPKIPLGTIGSLKFHPNSRDLGFTLSSARSPLDAYSIDVATRKLERWTASETGGLDASAFSEPEPVRWTSFDGRVITGFLYRPPARFTGPRPAIVNIHGGPEGQFQPGFLGRLNFYLNELGAALIFPNVRGSTGFGKTFLKLDNAEKREDSVRDIGALLDWIKTRPELDAARVMVTGGSYGGYMTLAAATHYSDRIRCAVDVVGISNFVTFLQRTEAYRRDLRRVEYGDERDPQMRELLLRISPLTNAAKIGCPMFIVAGKNDPRVSYQEAEQMVAQIMQNNGRVWYLLGKDEGHGFAKKPNADFEFLATIRFAQEFLLK